MDYTIWGIVTAAIGSLCFWLGYCLRAAQCGPCLEDELEPMEEIEIVRGQLL